MAPCTPLTGVVLLVRSAEYGAAVRQYDSVMAALPMRVRGNSMLPTLVEGDWVMVVPGSEVATGDIAVIDYAGTRVVHRVISRRRLVESGDGPGVARAFRLEQVVGRVVAVSRQGSTLDLTTARARIGGRLRARRSQVRLAVGRLGRISTGARGGRQAQVTL